MLASLEGLQHLTVRRCLDIRSRSSRLPNLSKLTKLEEQILLDTEIESDIHMLAGLPLLQPLLVGRGFFSQVGLCQAEGDVHYSRRVAERFDLVRGWRNCSVSKYFVCTMAMHPSLLDMITN